MDEVTFRKHLEDVLNDLPKEFQEKLENVEILVADEPDAEQREELHLRKYDRLFGLFTGVPQTVAGEDRATLPDRITLFRLPIIESYDTEEAIIRQIRDTLHHEIGHYFGIEEDKLRKLQSHKSSD